MDEGLRAAKPAGDPRRLPVGIFDSGVGGLTVLAALLKRLPCENYRYLGDTARLPYGTKSPGAVVRYSLQVAEKLVERDIKLLVVACNTATAAALPHLQKAYPHLPVLGVVAPGAKAACKVSRSGNILVIGTESTIRGGAYARAIHALRPEARVTGIACTLFVSLAEEGWMSGHVAEAIAARYLEPVARPAAAGHEENGAGPEAPDCLVLGCTHFPPLAPVIQSVVGAGVRLVDSAATTAEAVEERLRELDLLHPDQAARGAGNPAACPGAEERVRETADPLSRLHLLTTDAPERFARVGSLFLGMPLDAAALELVTL
jgi:glutamate racemase